MTSPVSKEHVIFFDTNNNVSWEKDFLRHNVESHLPRGKDKSHDDVTLLGLEDLDVP